MSYINLKNLDYSILINKEEYQLLKENNENPVHLVLQYHHAGFWSIFNKLMNYLLYYKNICKISYDVRSNVSEFYGNDEIFSHIFEEYNNGITHNLTINIKNYITYEATGCFANLLHLKESNWREKYNILWNKYIKIKDTMMIENIRSDKIIISVLIRHNALAHEQPNGRMPTFEQYNDKIQKLLNKYNNNVMILLATDVIEALEYFRTTYNNIELIHIPSIQTSNNTFEAQLVPNYKGNKSNIEIALKTVILLSKGHHFIFANSNMSTAVLYINTKIEPHFIIG